MRGLFSLLVLLALEVAEGEEEVLLLLGVVDACGGMGDGDTVGSDFDMFLSVLLFCLGFFAFGES